MRRVPRFGIFWGKGFRSFCSKAIICLAALIAAPSLAQSPSLDFNYVISGAGPGGLAAALELQRIGVEKILVVENRARFGLTTDATKNSKNSHGSRRRTVVLDDQSVAQLAELGVIVPGLQFSEIQIYHGDELHIIKNEGIQKDSYIYNLFGRSFNTILRVGDLENAMLERYIDNGGQISFESEIKIQSQTSDIAELNLVHKAGSHTENLNARQLLVFEGAKSKTRASLKIDQAPSHLGSNPQYYGADFNFSAGTKNQTGKAFLIFDQNSKLEGYGFVAEKGGSIGLPLSTKEMKMVQNEAEPIIYKKLERIARKIGIDPQSLGEAYAYSGALLQATRVNEGSIYILGDAARTTDPASANGLNTALRDAKAIGQYSRDRVHSSIQARENLISRIKENTRYTFQGSRHFEDVIEWAALNPSYAKELFRAGLPAIPSGKSLKTLTASVETGLKTATNALIHNLIPLETTNSIARNILTFAGVPTPLVLGGADRTRYYPVHPLQKQTMTGMNFRCQSVFEKK